MIMKPRDPRPNRKVRYAVVGLGHIAQNAVLPAFAHAKRNSILSWSTRCGSPVKKTRVLRLKAKTQLVAGRLH